MQTIKKDEAFSDLGNLLIEMNSYELLGFFEACRKNFTVVWFVWILSNLEAIVKM